MEKLWPRQPPATKNFLANPKGSSQPWQSKSKARHQKGFAFTARDSLRILQTPSRILIAMLPDPLAPLSQKLQLFFPHDTIGLKDESSAHAAHFSPLVPGKVSHIRLTIVSKKFHGLSLVDRHRYVYQILEEDLENGLHALKMILKTPEEMSALSSS